MFPRGMVASVCALALVGCNGQEDEKGEYATLVEIADGIAERCPMVEIDDVESRHECSEKLKDFSLLYQNTRSVVDWGGHKDDHESYDPAVHHLTEFPEYVWAATYLGQFMFSDKYEIEQVDRFTVVKLESQWRTRIGIENLPYPFNHDPAKWDAHQYSTHVYLVFEEAHDAEPFQMVAAYRYGDDRSRATSDPGAFDGQWTWFDEDGTFQPQVSVFSYVLSTENPYRVDTEDAWYDLFNAYEALSCNTSCHNPTNPVAMAQLELLSHPGQTLAVVTDRPGGKTLVEVLDDESMPPDRRLDEGSRGVILPLAMRFQDYGQAALAYEDERHAP